MKVVLYMAISVNGLIAKENDDTSFVSKIEWKSFRAMIKKADVMVIGRHTYDIMKESDELNGLKNTNIVVLTNGVNRKSEMSNITFTNLQPKELLKKLEKEKHKFVLIAGGGILNGSFVKENLVDEIILDVEPVVFGKGIGLFGDSDFEARLRLAGTKKLSMNEIQLRYKVVKKH